jgi:hypothetical protein
MKNNNDGFISLADNDNDDLVVIHTKRMLTEEKLRQENRQLLETNRRLEQQKDECKAKFDLLDSKSNEYIHKVKNDMQVSKSKLSFIQKKIDYSHKNLYMFQKGPSTPHGVRYKVL